MSLDKSAILSADDLPRKEVDVPEWGGLAYIRVMRGDQRDEFERLLAGREEAGLRNIDVLVTLLTECLCDEEGTLLFTKDDAPKLKQRNGAVLQRLAEFALRINGLTEDEVGGLEKNSANEATDVSISV